MINYTLKQEVFIGKYFNLGTASPKGWRQNLTGCPYCHDGRSKNPRSHFLFSNEQVGWQCFNCGSKHRFSGNNVQTMANFISKSAWKKVGALLLEIKKEKVFPNSDLKNQEDLKNEVGDDNIDLINYKEVELPEVSLDLSMDVTKIAPFYRTRFIEYRDKALDYLKKCGLSDRLKTTTLYVCMDGDYSNRLIFPIYFDGKLVSWAARALFPTKTKYLYPPSEDEFNDRGTIIYGLDSLFASENVKQLFVFESINDSLHTHGGLAVLSKNITKEQIAILKNFNFYKKKLIFVLDNDKLTKWDKDLKGGELGMTVLKAREPNWVVSIPKFGTNIKDLSESIKYNGFLETYDAVMSGVIRSEYEIKLKMKLKAV